MGQSHLKRIASPKAWNISRKGMKFVTKPAAGPHSLQTGMPINILLKDILNYASTTSEVKKILSINEIKVDGKSRKDFRFPVGIFDTIEFTSTQTHFRVIFNKKGKLDLVKINKEEAALKPCKIIGKTMVNGKLQLNLYDGKNIFVNDGAYKGGDTVLLSLPGQKINKHLKLDKKSAVFLIGGKHAGEIGNIEDIIKDKITYRDKNGSLIETSKKYAFVVGDTKPSITLV